MNPLIITCSVTGSTNIPSMSPHLPLTFEQIADSAVAAAQAGAAVVHIHTRKPQDGRPSFEPEDYLPIIQSIKARTEAVIALTSPGIPDWSIEKRLVHVVRFRPEMAALVPGTINYALHNRVKDVRTFIHDWEKPFLERSRDGFFRATFADLEEAGRVFKASQTKPSFESFDAGQLHNLAFLVQEGAFDLPVHLEFVLGALGGIGGDEDDLLFLVNKCRKLFGPENFTWSVCGLVGAGEFRVAPLAIALGGHLRVGLEDTVYLRPGVLAKSNVEHVARAVRMAEAFGRPVASPAEARNMLGLKGKDQVAF